MFVEFPFSFLPFPDPVHFRGGGGSLYRLLALLTVSFLLAPLEALSTTSQTTEEPPAYPEFPDKQDDGSETSSSELSVGGMSALTSSGATFDPTSPPEVVDVSGHTGGFSTSVPLQVPSFRGLEPSLALVYGSSGGSGIAGVGWNVSGFGQIERKSADGGWPRFDSTDTYWLGGQKLVPCGGSASPGCSAGGTHFTESENYSRIVDNGDDTWTVTSRSGVESTYAVMGFSGTRKFRYGLASRTDRLGNTVSYTWDCASDTDYCYPETVSYNGAVVTFHRESRPDPISEAGGIVQHERLKTVDVELSGQRVRAYALAYGSSATTERSLLASVTMYGTDAALDGSGAVLSGTSLPPTSYTYRDDPQFAQFDWNGGYWTQEWCHTGSAGTIFSTGDFDGDGKTDVYCHYGPTYNNDTYIGLSDGTSFQPFQLAVAGWCDSLNATFTTGDPNGDGFTDFICQKHSQPRYTEVSLSNGDGTFGTPTTWLATNFCEIDMGMQWGTVDANGDGKTDIWCHKGDQGQDAISVGLSTGTDFQASQWGNWCWTVDATFTFGPDVNGDGNGDAVCRGTSSGFVDVLLSKGDGFSGTFPSLTYFCDGTMTFGAGDFNADGKSDLWCRQPVDTAKVRGMYVAMSTGESWTGWTSPTDYSAAPYWCSGDFQVGTGEFNGDGRSDLYCHEPSGSQNTWVILSNDVVDGFSTNAVWLTNWCQAWEHTGDFDGDGKTDVMCHIGNDTSVATAGGMRGRTDVLTQIVSPTGGTRTITYTPSSDWENTNNPPVRETVTSVTLADGRGWQATTSWEYAGGKIDRERGRTLGFAYSKVTPPKLANETAAPYTESWFSQELASVGAVTKTERRDGSGNLLLAAETTLATSGDGEIEPYTAKVTDRTSYVYDGTVTECTAWPCSNGERRYQEFDYDSFGNRVEVRDFGNLDAADDERTTVLEFYPNTADYVVNRVARTSSYYGIGTLGAMLTDALVFYDGAGSYNVSPSVGLRTNGSVWLNTESRYVAQCPQGICVEYDAFGNVTKTIDVNNAETLFAYDPTYDQFPVSITNALGHVATTDWDFVCEAPSVTTDPNQQQTTTTYDALCRHERTDGPGGVFSESVYANLGNPSTQYTEAQSPSPDGSGTFWSRTYFDGLGRSYASESESGEVGQIVVSGEVTFNPRGLVATAAQPRFDTDPQFVTSFTYDPRNRVLQRTLPDTNVETFSYGLNVTLHYDPEGDLTSNSRSPNGLVTYLGEYLDGVPVVTTTVVDVDARTEHVYDDVDNHWMTVFDSLGRPVSITDPDSGTETREYHDSGLLTATVNALGERTELTYDLLGRLLTKTTRTGTPEAEVTTFTYDQARTGYFNKGYLTRMDDVAGFEERDYDLLGRPARTKRNLDAQDYVFEFSYNLAGLPSSTVYPDADVVSWTYDAAGGLETETGTITASTYDAAGRLVSRGFANGVTTDITYSQVRGWVENIHTFKNSTTHQDLDYQYYADGMIASVTSPKYKESWTYQYDDLNRLTSAVNVDDAALSQSFVYDSIGNITWNSQIGSYSYPNPGDPLPHAVTTAGSRTYAYNAAGQMTSRNGTVLQWNGDGKPSAIGNIGFVYDGVGSRLKKLSGGQTTRYLGGDYEIADDGTITKYLAGGKKQGTDFFIHHRDHLGSIQVVSGPAGWQVLRQKHKPFGDQHAAVGSHLESKGWIGEREEETELLYLNARYYDPEIGRFTAPDPIRTPGQGLNRYSYSLNTPIAFKDPSGLKTCTTVPVPPGTTDALGRPIGWRVECTDAGFDESWGDAGPSFPSGHGPCLPAPCDGTLPDDDESHGGDGGSGGPGGTTGPPPGPDDSTPPPPTGPPPDNPLYNCQNGKKTNCPDNRRGQVTPEMEAAAKIVYQEVERTFPELIFDKHTVLRAHNGHVNISVLGMGDHDAFFGPLGQGQGPFGYRFDNWIGGTLYSLHVHVRGPFDMTAHLDRGNPHRDLLGLFEHVFVDVIIGFLFHRNDPGLDPGI